jgi:hypothetical protein
MSFELSVRLWKLFGAGLWSILLTVLVLLLLRFTTDDPVTIPSFIFIIISQLGLLLSHSYTFSIVPRSFRVLTLQQVFFRFVHFFTHILFSNLCASTFAPSSRTTTVLSIITTCWILFFEKFAFIVCFQKRSRISKIAELFSSFVPAILLALISYFLLSAFFQYFSLPPSTFFPFNPTSIIQLFVLLVLSAITHSISTVILSESVSFAVVSGLHSVRPHRSKSRLAQNLTSRGFLQFLAFEDLFEIATGPPARRAFLFKDSSGRIFRELFESCVALLHNFNQHYGRLSSQTFRSPSPSPRTVVSLSKRAGLRLLRPIVEYQRRGDQETRKLGVEAAALDESVLVIYAAKSLVRLLDVLQAEDHFGIGQQFAESIVQALMEARNAIEPVLGYRWGLEEFGRGWFVRRPLDLLIRTREVIDWCLNELAKRFRGRLDLGSSDISRQNAAAFRRRPERRL